MKNHQQAWHAEYSVKTIAGSERIWAIFQDVSGWHNWNPGVEQATLEGPFAKRTWFTMKPPEQEVLRSQLIDVREGECFVDETRVQDLVVTVAHSIERLTTGLTCITYAVDVVGIGATEVGPAVASDFPQVLATLVKLAVEASS